MSNRLFSPGNVFQVIENQRAALRQAIDGYDGDRMLNTSPDDLATYFAERFDVMVPRISGEIAAEQRETAHEGTDMFGDHVTQKGTEYLLYVPFEGEEELLHAGPSSHRIYSYHTDITEREIVFRVTPLNSDSASLKRDMEGIVSSLTTDLATMERDFATFKSSLKPSALQQIEQRRAKLLADRNMVSSLGFALRQRPDAPRTYAAPEVRRRIVPPPPASSAPYVPEPTLPTPEYENILTVIRNMALVMERNPSTFCSAPEEALRDHILVQLNGQYEGTATGETFNAGGKTDILIRQNGGNLFIAECKFWGGEKKLFETVDQMLGYVTWRDTKTCIIIFNRNKNFSGVLDVVRGQMTAHPHYKRTLETAQDTSFRYILSHPNDPNKELVTTVLLFDIPQPA